MQNFLTSAWRTIRHNRYLAIALVVASAIAGCTLFEPKTQSLEKPDVQVGWTGFEREVIDGSVELEAEGIRLKGKVEAFAKKVQLGRDDLLAKQDKIDTAIGFLKTAIGTVVPLGYGELFIGLFAALFGASQLDNKRKDGVIHRQALMSNGLVPLPKRKR